MLQRLDALLDHGEWVQVKREAEQLMLLPDLDNRTLGRIYRAGARACIGLGEFHAAVKLMELGMPYAIQSEDWDTVGFMRHDLGTALLVLADTKGAREQFVAYLLDLPRYTDARSKEGKAHYNLGLLYRQCKEYDLAIAAYRQALHCFVERGATRDTGDCHQNIAWLHLVQRRPGEARIHIDLAAGFLEGLSPDYRVEQLILLGFYHTVVNELRTAADYLAPVLDGRMDGTLEHMASAKWVEAQVNAEQDKWPSAKASLDQAWEYALKSKAAHLVSLCADLGEKFRKLGGAAP